jgi:hypothetical protein
MTLEIKDIYKEAVYRVGDTGEKNGSGKVGDGINCKSALCPVVGITGGVELSVSSNRRAIQQASDEFRNCACLNNMSL